MAEVIFIDVDDTLVRSVGSKRIPMSLSIQGVKRLKEQGHRLYLWSSGGGEYAKATAVELGIEDIFEAFLPKPTCYVDDLPVAEWPDLQHYLPLQIPMHLP